MLPGKGKHGVKRSGKANKESMRGMPSSSKTKDVDVVKVEPTESRERSSTALPIIKIADNENILPCYTAVLSRSKEDGLAMDELGGLQLELESLLVCAAQRHRSLLDDIVQVKSAEEKRDKRSKIFTSKSLTTPTSATRRGTGRSDDRPLKTSKDALRTRLPSGKLNKLREFPSHDSPKPEASKIVIPKNETANKFWASVDPYCAPITSEDLSYLSDLIRMREEEQNSDMFTVPPLGKHYTVLWSEENMAEDIKRPMQLGGTTGPLTQRLVSALMEEKLIPSLNQDKPSKELSSSRANTMRQVQSLSFEKRVREELREQGILDGDEAPKEQDDDELLLEIKRVQSELKALSAQNLERLRHVQSLAEAQVKRQERKKKQTAIDGELLNIHAAKRKGGVFTEKEREQAWRLIKEREVLLKQLHPNFAN